MKTSPALVRALLASEMPQLALAELTPVTPGGNDHHSFRLGDKMIIRLPSAKRYAPQVTRDQVWLPRIAPHLPVEIPAQVTLRGPTGLFPMPWAVYQWIDADIWDDTQPNCLRLARDLAAFLTALHMTPAPDAPVPSEDNFHRGGDLSVYAAETEAALAKHAAQINGTKAAHIWAEALASKWSAPPLLVHGDVARGNLLFRNGYLAAVLDWGAVCIGDPACDLVMAWTEFDAPSREVFFTAVRADPDTIARARGWALWKAVITLDIADRRDDAVRCLAELGVM